MIDDDADEGLAGERTDLAWNRTGLSMAVILLSLVRAVLLAPALVQGLALGLGVLGAATWAVGLRRAQALAMTTPTGRDTAERRVLTLIAAGTVVIAVAGSLLASFSDV